MLVQKCKTINATTTTAATNNTPQTGNDERERNFCRGPDASKTLQFQDMVLDVGEIEFHRMQLDFVR